MSNRSIIVIRESHDVLHEAVLLALELNWDIKTMNPVFNHTYSDYYIICESADSHNSLFKIQATLSDSIESIEFRTNTEHKQYSVFHSFEYKQYQKDTAEDRQQIHELAHLILQFCKERMYIEPPVYSRPQPSVFDTEEYILRYLRRKGIL